MSSAAVVIGTLRVNEQLKDTGTNIILTVGAPYQIQYSPFITLYRGTIERKEL